MFIPFFQFDTKSSPLALLAQTCSAIGSDAPNPKLLANIEKSSKRDKSSPSSNLSNGSPNEIKSSFKPYESGLKDNDAPDDLRVASRIKPQNKPITTSNVNGAERCESTNSISSQQTRKSPSTISPKTSNEKSASMKPTTPTEPSRVEMQKEALRSLAGASYPSMPYFNGYPYPYSMELLSQHQSMLKAAAMNPYLNYARMKAAAGDMMMGICRDPYCTGCSLSSHFLGKNGTGSQCPPGCTCDHSANKAMASNPAAAMAYHAQLAQLAAASQMPYV